MTPIPNIPAPQRNFPRPKPAECKHCFATATAAKDGEPLCASCLEFAELAIRHRQHLAETYPCWQDG